MKPKTMKVIMWVLIALMTVQFSTASLGKFTGAWNNKFIEWGYSISFMYLIGALEIGSVIALFIPKARMWAVLILILTMVGATATHLLCAEYSRLIHMGLIFVILSFIYYLDKRLISH